VPAPAAPMRRTTVNANLAVRLADRSELIETGSITQLGAAPSLRGIAELGSFLQSATGEAA
jgi:hypothetical protein